MIRAPQPFIGTWSELYTKFIEPNLPSVEAVRICHDWMRRYADDPASVLPVRLVGSGDRRTRSAQRQEFVTRDGTRLMFADNSPAWVLHAWLTTGYITSYDMFRISMTMIPCHMFDIKKQVRVSMNDFGWYVAHLYPAKNRDTDWKAWSRAEVQRRFYLTLHPCNIFFVPGTRNSDRGENPSVIGFAADRYAEGYGPVWADFVEVIGGKPLPTVPDFGEHMVHIVSSPREPPAPPIPPSLNGTTLVRYPATRLAFRGSAIEPLGLDDSFQVDTPVGSFRFTKRQFYDEFPGVVRSTSYRLNGLYHYPSLPRRAERYRVG